MYRVNIYPNRQRNSFVYTQMYIYIVTSVSRCTIQNCSGGNACTALHEHSRCYSHVAGLASRLIIVLRGTGIFDGDSFVRNIVFIRGHVRFAPLVPAYKSSTALHASDNRCAKD